QNRFAYLRIRICIMQVHPHYDPLFRLVCRFGDSERNCRLPPRSQSIRSVNDGHRCSCNCDSRQAGHSYRKNKTAHNSPRTTSWINHITATPLRLLQNPNDIRSDDPPAAILPSPQSRWSAILYTSHQPVRYIQSAVPSPPFRRYRTHSPHPGPGYDKSELLHNHPCCWHHCLLSDPCSQPHLPPVWLSC